MKNWRKKLVCGHQCLEALQQLFWKISPRQIYVTMVR
nr:unnamed protein product [Callosobruchus chinensis]